MIRSLFTAAALFASARRPRRRHTQNGGNNLVSQFGPL